MKGPMIKDKRFNLAGEMPRDWSKDPFRKFKWYDARLAITNTSIPLYGHDVSALVSRVIKEFRKSHKRQPRMVCIWNYGVEAI
jgi:hypothetical protein